MATTTHDLIAEETRVREVLDEITNALIAHDLDRLLACYAPDVIAFDAMPPLQCVGLDAYRKNWEMAMDCFQATSTYELRDLHIAIGDDVACCHALNHMVTRTADGKEQSMWARWTGCLRRIDDTWLITHEHFSMPIDMQTGKALTDLAP